jgi:hypothetical protein
MSDEQESTPELPAGELREITLRIPGECFFCESIDLPESLSPESNGKESTQISKWDGYLCELLNKPQFSPYPEEQLAWGYHLCEDSNKAFVFATPLGRLRQMGWQNLELFRRVFPSFISLLGKTYESPTALFLLCDESLSLACFSANSSVPDFLYSRTIDLEQEEGFDKAKAMLLGLADLSKYVLCPDILVARDVYRKEDNSFLFEHQWMKGKDASLELDQDLRMDADQLWQHDLRSLDFKISEKNRRRQERARWKSIKVSSIFAIFLVIGFVSLKILDIQVDSFASKEARMRSQVPLVLESQKLLEKLRQNKLGGIDPFGTIGRVAVYRGGSLDNNPHVWFSQAHFETRNHVKLEGEGRNVESVNNFIERLETNQVAVVRSDRTGDELRNIKSGGGSTSFDVEFEMLEVKEAPVSNEQIENDLNGSLQE